MRKDIISSFCSIRVSLVYKCAWTFLAILAHDPKLNTVHFTENEDEPKSVRLLSQSHQLSLECKFMLRAHFCTLLLLFVRISSSQVIHSFVSDFSTNDLQFT